MVELTCYGQKWHIGIVDCMRFYFSINKNHEKTILYLPIPDFLQEIVFHAKTFLILRNAGRKTYCFTACISSPHYLNRYQSKIPFSYRSAMDITFALLSQLHLPPRHNPQPPQPHLQCNTYYHTTLSDPLNPPPITNSDGNLGRSYSPYTATREIVLWASSTDLWRKKPYFTTFT